MMECPKCNGTGYIHQYRNVENGICFLCRGAKTIGKYNPKYDTDLDKEPLCSGSIMSFLKNLRENNKKKENTPKIHELKKIYIDEED